MYNSNGEDLSKRVVKNQIEAIVSKENAAMPLSDQEIANILKKDGINLARRTVTKYREEIGIKSARFRKQLAKKPQSIIVANPEALPTQAIVQSKDLFQGEGAGDQ